MATTTPTQRATRDARILYLVRDGYSEREIAKRIGVSRSTVWARKQAMTKQEA
jgi:transposase